MSNKEIKVEGTPKTYGDGATRHTKEGKGRFDLIPHEVFTPLFERVAKLDITDPYMVECTPHSIITDIANDRPIDAIIKITIYHYYRDASVLEAIDNNISPERFVHCCWPMFKDLAVHFQKGAEIYGERNCQKGIPAWSFKDSAMRHATQYFNHEEDEPHLISAIWNLWLLAWTFIHELETNTTSDSKTKVVPWINKLREEIKPDFDFKKKYEDTYNKLEKNNCIKVSVAKLKSNDPDEKAKMQTICDELKTLANKYHTPIETAKQQSYTRAELEAIVAAERLNAVSSFLHDETNLPRIFSNLSMEQLFAEMIERIEERQGYHFNDRFDDYVKLMTKLNNAFLKIKSERE